MSGRQGQARTADSGAVDWPATLLGGRPRQRSDVRWQLRRGSAQELWLVIVDASASTHRHQALSAAKGLLAQLFDKAYRQRARLALLTASGPTPRWQRHGLKASSSLAPWLESLGAGGGTPLLAAIEQARQWLQRRQRRQPGEQQRCMLITDGRLKPAPLPAPLPCPTQLIDIERGPIRLARGQALARQLAADYRHIDALGD